MDRRAFLAVSVAAIANGALAGCALNTSAKPRAVTAAAFQRTRRFARTPFGSIAYVQNGRGPATALFLHGYPLNGFQWRGAFDRLSAQRRCIAPDFMGLGYTETPEGQDLSAQAQTDMLVALLELACRCV